MPRKRTWGSSDKGSTPPLQGSGRGSIPRTSTNPLDRPFGFPRPAPKPSQTRKPRGREKKTEEEKEE